MSEPKRVSEYVDAALEMCGVDNHDLPYSREDIMIAIDNREHEMNGTLHAPSIAFIVAELNVLYARLKELNDPIQPTFSVGEDGEPMI